MPGGRTLAGLGLKAFFDLGEDGWNDEMDTNLLVLSALVQPRVLSIVSADPGAPADGDIHYFDGDHPTQANKVAIRDNGAWVYIAAFQGMKLYNVDDSTNYEFDGADLVASSVGGAAVLEVAGAAYDVDAADKGKYIRLTNAGAKTINVRDEADHALPINGEWHFRNVGVGDATFVEDTAVTINAPAGGSLVVGQDGTVTLKRIAADEFDLMGSTLP